MLAHSTSCSGRLTTKHSKSCDEPPSECKTVQLRRCKSLTTKQWRRNPPRSAAHTTEWEALSAALTAAFALTGKVSPDHPAAAALAGANHARLARELRGRANWVAGEYTRVPLLSGSGFDVLLLCWSPGAESPVHAHSDARTGVKSNCFMLVLENALVETTYERAQVHQTEVERGAVSGAGTARTLAAGTCGYICDDLGVHKVGNATAKGSLSLHVYAPGWVAVSLYREVHGEVDAGGAPIDVDAWGDF